RARVSRDTNGAEAEPGSKGPIPQVRQPFRPGTLVALHLHNLLPGSLAWFLNRSPFGSCALFNQDDSGYLLTLGLGSVGGAAAVKYGSVLLPDITRPNIVEALLMVSLPMAVAALILLKLSSTSTQD
uniref:Uncharacterized protein n=1 Tax=Aegilops tauschii subsp. strangulata TaxID=200361 RepID=A0A453PYM3_AEGTS